ncbi:MAG TPA: hypothetical protein VK927_09495, partial [Adhaeribacter sp.]|nr:hypothetical protein [Adhaeribacter sp.]
ILANIRLLNGDLKAAETQIGRIKQLLPNTAFPYKHLKGFYPLMARYASLKGNYELAYRYSDSAHFVRDSLQTLRSNVMTTKAEQKIELERHRAQMQQLETEDKLQKLQRNGLLGGIILLTIIALLVINRQRLVHRQKQEKLEKEKNTIESELELASRKLNDFTDHIREKNKLIEKFSAELKNHQDRFGEPEQRAHLETRDKLLRSTILTDDQWEEFRQLFDKVHAGYLQRLREKLPVLSPAETRYFVLSKLKLTPKEMASMLGVRPDAIRLYRHRLRKKLAIEEDTVLEELVNNI